MVYSLHYAQLCMAARNSCHNIKTNFIFKKLRQTKKIHVVQILDLRALPWGETQHDLALGILRRHQGLIHDWTVLDRKAHLKMALDLRSPDGSVAAFWRELLARSVRAFALIFFYEGFDWPGGG